MYYLISFLIFLFFMGGNLPLSIACWLLFICFIKPEGN